MMNSSASNKYSVQKHKLGPLIQQGRIHGSQLAGLLSSLGPIRLHRNRCLEQFQLE